MAAPFKLAPGSGGNYPDTGGEGSLKTTSLIIEDEEAGDDDVSERIWGRSRADKGYFVTDWDLVTMRDPERQVIPAKVPASLVRQLR